MNGDESRLTIDETIRRAIQCHKTGNLPRAEQLYKAILEVNPHHPDANHNLGVLLGSQGQWMHAVPLFKAATQALPSEAQYWLSLIRASLSMGDKSSAQSFLEDALSQGFEEQPFKQFKQELGLSNRVTPNPPKAVRIPSYAERRKGEQLKKKLRKSRSASLTNEPPSGSNNPVGGLLELFQRGELIEAEEKSLLMTQESPGVPFGWKLLGVIHMQTGRVLSALELLQQALTLAPKDPEIYNSLGNAYYRLDRKEAAESSYRQAIKLKNIYPEAHTNLGNVLRDLRQLHSAEESCRKAIQQKIDYAEAYFNLANVLIDLNKHTESVLAFRKALELRPFYPEAHGNLGVVLKELGLVDEAERAYREAIRLKPDYAESHNNLGNLLKQKGNLTDAVVAYHQSIQCNSAYADAYKNLGEALRELKNHQEAKEACLEAIRIRPNYASAHACLGHIYRHLCDLPASQAAFQTASRLDPSSGVYALNAELFLPSIMMSSNDIMLYRAQFEETIRRLNSRDLRFESPASEGSAYGFDLAYHNEPNRCMAELLAGFFKSKAPVINFYSPHLNGWSAPINRRIRIGICSTFLVGHTIGKLYRGLVEKLDRSRFEVIVIHGALSKCDTVGELISRSADHSLRLTPKVEQQQKDIAQCELDVLFYPDIGMSPETYFLAYSRLAPVQCVSWGHPDTTGISNLDYFLSCALIEKEGAEEHYTERLIRFNRLPCFYEPFPWSMNAGSRAFYGLPEQGTLYGCPQSLFKLHPDFDGILAEISRVDPSGSIVLLEGSRPELVKDLKQRWLSRYPLLVERTIFLPRVPYEQFMGLLTQFDVLLDPVHFGSGNTMYESMPLGIPTVTWPGQFMRGRIVAGAYRQMGLSEPPIADSIESYAALAVELGTNRVRREAVKQQILSAVHRELLADDLAVREFEEFFIHAVDAASRGERLPAGWRPQVTKGVLH